MIMQEAMMNKANLVDGAPDWTKVVAEIQAANNANLKALFAKAANTYAPGSTPVKVVEFLASSIGGDFGQTFGIPSVIESQWEIASKAKTRIVFIAAGNFGLFDTMHPDAMALDDGTKTIKQLLPDLKKMYPVDTELKCDHWVYLMDTVPTAQGPKINIWSWGSNSFFVSETLLRSMLCGVVHD